MSSKLPTIIQAEQSLLELTALKNFLYLQQKTPELLDLINTIEQVELQAGEVFRIPQIIAEFNSFFNSLGWHAHDFINLDIARQANLLAQQGDICAAENLLVTYYIENFNTYCTLLKGLPTYWEREHIIEKAKERFLAEDYISCVPLVLMMADGFSNDMLNKGIFTDGAQLDAWDCLTAHNGELKEFIKFITKTRRKFSTESISIPYRNGIMHGLDVGYDNKLTAIKAWALLFTLREVLIRKKNEPEAKSKFENQQQKKLDDLQAFIKNLTKYTADSLGIAESFYNWSPRRTVEEWATVPRGGSLSDYTPATPEYCLVSFLYGWQAQKYGIMADLIQLPQTLSVKKLAGDFRDALSSKHLTGFSIDFIQEDRGGIAIGTKLSIDELGKESWEREIVFIVNNYVDDQINFSPNKNGSWKLHDVAIPMICYMCKQENLNTLITK